MTYATLKTDLAAFSHRTDLTSVIPTFVALAEGMIRRDLVGYELTATLDETDRSALGVYNLPTGVSVIRAVYDEDEVPLENVGTNQIKSVADDSDPQYFTVLGEQVEFRGVPATDAEFTIRYFGVPAALSDDADTNALLEDHYALYLYGALFFLYQYTQDVELAQGALDTFTNTIETLNDAHGRKVSGASAFNAGYNFRNLPRRGGY